MYDVETMEWNDVYALWSNGKLKTNEKITKPVIPELIPCECKKEGYYTYKFDWLNNINVNRIKESVVKGAPVPCYSTLKGIILTATMLVSAKTEEEVAAIWIGALCKPICDRCDRRLPIYENAVMFYDAAVCFLHNRFPVWQHYHTDVLPNHTTSYKELLGYVDKRKHNLLSDKQNAMNYIQECALKIINGCTIVEITSADKEELKHSRVSINVRWSGDSE